MSRGRNEVVGEFKMIVGDVISIGGEQVMAYPYIARGIKRGYGEIWCGLRPEGVNCRGC